ncbi:hypothetical protein HGRIS_004519 [Hohenbuehelia grisea]|uniref:DUF6533 domain-containing protein n=1 Tax=Hohenbuehelia grisea TaxID=104357 RepID=A0ABR3JC45_9AGAR
MDSCLPPTQQSVGYFPRFVYASAAVVLYDFLLTFANEVSRIWPKPALSPTIAAYFVARYSAVALASLVLFSVGLVNMCGSMMKEYSIILSRPPASRQLLFLSSSRMRPAWPPMVMSIVFHPPFSSNATDSDLCAASLGAMAPQPYHWAYSCG